MVIPVGLPGAQQLVVAEKDLNGRVTTKEIMPVCSRCSRNPTSLHSGRPDQHTVKRSPGLRTFTKGGDVVIGP
jgi:hypothetical protein